MQLTVLAHRASSYVCFLRELISFSPATPDPSHQCDLRKNTKIIPGIYFYYLTA
jgi:hypothetical protein